MTDGTAAGGGAKRCSKCREVKTLDRFSRRAASLDGLQYYCKDCIRAHAVANRERVRDARNAWRREWLARNPGKDREYHRRFNETHPGYAAAKTKEWREKNPERVAEQRANHPDYAREWRARNPDKVADWVNKRRALIAGASDVRPVIRSEIAERDGWRCHICGGRVTRKNWSIDHLVPLSKGGPHVPENVRLAHRLCNSRRGPGRLPAQLLLL